MQEKKCSKCGVAFGCCANGSGCWCEQYSVAPRVLAELKEDFDDCLCEQCLKEYAINSLEKKTE